MTRHVRDFLPEDDQETWVEDPFAVLKKDSANNLRNSVISDDLLDRLDREAERRARSAGKGMEFD